MIKRKVYPLPKITDTLCKCHGYKYFTKLDISMQYYTFELDNKSKEICTATTPLGNYCYKCLPMGVNQAPDIAQEIMEDYLHDISEYDVYLNDIGVFSDDWHSHLQSLEKVLQ